LDRSADLFNRNIENILFLDIGQTTGFSTEDLDVKNGEKRANAEDENQAFGLDGALYDQIRHERQDHEHAEHAQSTETHGLVDHGFSRVEPGSGSLCAFEGEHVHHQANQGD